MLFGDIENLYKDDKGIWVKRIHEGHWVADTYSMLRGANKAFDIDARAKVKFSDPRKSFVENSIIPLFLERIKVINNFFPEMVSIPMNLIGDNISAEIICHMGTYSLVKLIGKGLWNGMLGIVWGTEVLVFKHFIELGNLKDFYTENWKSGDSVNFRIDYDNGKVNIPIYPMGKDKGRMFLASSGCRRHFDI